jgi:hypoxanthine phosphoribosyltransferase
MKMKHTHVGGIPFALLNWQDLTTLTEKLAAEILSSGQEFDRIIAVANGGLTMVRHLADRLNLKTISVLQISSYQGVAEHDPEPIIQQPMPLDVQGEKLLIFEDIVDTGSTLLVMDQYLETIGVSEYWIATQVEKSKTVRNADYVGARMDEWLIFPYEIRETIVDLMKKWRAEQIPDSEIRERLLTIGFASEDIDLYLD